MHQQIGIRAARREWKEGWPVVLSAFFGISTPVIAIYTMGLFVGPLQAEFGWNRSQVTLGLMVNAVVMVLLSPFVGAMIDRYGSRRIAIPGVAIFLACFAALSLANGNIFLWWGLWLLVALASLLVKAGIWATAIAGRFEVHRGLAMAVMLSGTGIASIGAPAIGGFLMATHGWRATYIGLAALWAIVTLPLLLLFFYGAADLQRHQSARRAALISPSSTEGMDWKDAIMSPTFLKLAISVFPISIVLTGTFVSFIPLMTSIDRTPKEAAAIASIIGVATIIGRLLSGSLMDRVNGATIGVIAFGLPVIAFASILLFPAAHWMPFAAAATIGLSAGAEMEIAAYLIARHFGMVRYATLFAIISALIALATGLGPLLASAVYDLSGSYRPAMWAAIPMCLFSAILIGTMGGYPDEHR